MAVIGDLAVTVSAHTFGLTRGLGDAAGSVLGFGNRLGGLAGKILPVGAAIGGLIGSIKGVMSVAHQFGELDRIAKSARALGMTVEDLIGIEHAADLAGVSTESLHMGLKRLAREGLDLATIADQMQAITDPTERARFAFEKLGKQGQDLIPFLMEGGDAIRAMAAEGKELAGVSGVDAAGIEEANDAVTRMKLSFTGVARDLAVLLAPAVTFVGDKVQVLGRWMRSTFADVRPVVLATGKMIRAVFGFVGDVAETVFSFIGGAAGTTLESVKEFLVDSLIVGEFLFMNLSDVAALAWERVKLGGVGFWEDIRHLFTVQIPAVLDWFGGNWRDVFYTAADFALTVLINLGQNIRQIFSNLMDALSGELSFGDILQGVEKDLTKGFVSSLKSLPEIPERTLTDIEQGLASNIDQMSAGLSDRLGQHMVERREELLGTGDFDLKKGLALDLPDDLEGLTKDTGSKSADAIDFGLSQAQQQALQLQAHGAGETPQQKSVKQLESANTKLAAIERRMTDLLSESRRQTQAVQSQPQPASIGA